MRRQQNAAIGARAAFVFLTFLAVNGRWHQRKTRDARR